MKEVRISYRDKIDMSLKESKFDPYPPNDRDVREYLRKHGLNPDDPHLRRTDDPIDGSTTYFIAEQDDEPYDAHDSEYLANL